MWTEPAFDLHQFAGRKAHAVSALLQGDGTFATPGLAFSDLNTMHIKKRKETGCRRLATPAWAVNDNTLRETVLRYCERRLYIEKHTGTLEERLARVAVAVKEQEQRKTATLKFYLQLFNDSQRRNIGEAALARMAEQIQIFDTEVMILRRGLVPVVTAVAYLYYRHGLNSTRISNELGLKPPMVRMMLYRLNGKQSPSCNKPSGHVVFWSEEVLRRLFLCRATGKTFRECAQILGTNVNNVQDAWRYHFKNLRCKFTTRGIHKSPKRPDPLNSRWSLEDIAKIAFLRNVEHKTFIEIARVFGQNKPQGINGIYRRYCLPKN